jgi:hypothetical protein
MENKINNKPVKVFAFGALKAAVWTDSRVVNNSIVEMHSVRIDRTYKDKDSNEWKHTNVFFAEDLLKLAALASEVYKWLRLRSFEPGLEANKEDNVPQNEQNNYS